MTENPYSTPTAEAPLSMDESVPSGNRALLEIARPTFLAWERLRIVFIVILGLLTILLAGSSITRLRTIVLVVEGAIVANLCYFAGPVIETYVRWLGYDGKWVRWFLFIGGTLLTSVLAVAILADTLIPDQD